jgi:Holliday junction resolvasome RuvABC endonuclease subunit
MTATASARGRSNRVLALDLSLTSTGVALPDGIAYTISGKSARGPERLALIRARVLTLVMDCEPQSSVEPPLHVAIEGPAFGRANGMHALGQLAGVIYLALHERGIRPVIVPPSSLKKYATGKGNAPKELVLVEAVKRLGYDGSDDNEADALWLRALVMDALGEPVVTVPATHRAALAKVEVDR